MGTNYYIMTDNKKLAKKYFDGEYELVDEPFFGYEIHIGKRSLGWKPLFETHKKAYNSVTEMKQFIKEHCEDIKIFDEYGEQFSLDGLQEELIDWGENQQVRYMKYIPGGIVRDTLCGWRDYFIESTENDYDITIPYDHLEYSSFDTGQMWGSSRYFHDIDRYDFTEGYFC